MDDIKGRKDLLKMSGLKKGKILDIGVGNCGCMSLFLAKRGFEVTGIDPSAWAIHKSRKETARVKLRGSFQVMKARAENLPFKNNSFDAVFAYHSLHHIRDPKKAIEEMFRVCREGGRVVISDLHSRGRKDYDHEPDPSFIRKIGIWLQSRGRVIKKGRTDINMMFVCKKDSKK